VRDHSRLPFATKALTNVGYLAPEDAEALAALAATKLCEEMGFDQIHFVGDAKVVVDGVTTGDLDAIRP
jgi:ribonuclease HI